MTWFKYRPMPGPAVTAEGCGLVFGCLVQCVIYLGVLYVIAHFVVKYW